MSPVDVEPPEPPAQPVQDGGRELARTVPLEQLLLEGSLVLTQVDRASVDPGVLLPLVAQPVRGTFGLAAGELRVRDFAGLHVFELTLAICAGSFRSGVTQATSVSEQGCMPAVATIARPSAAHGRQATSSPRQVPARLKAGPMGFVLEWGIYHALPA